ncbi:hypothetical protein NL676_029239 [Syzygium grande]|nr:hypothetical protein NL676_029239 [Syzygium grande]
MSSLIRYGIELNVVTNREGGWGEGRNDTSANQGGRVVSDEVVPGLRQRGWLSSRRLRCGCSTQESRTEPLILKSDQFLGGPTKPMNAELVGQVEGPFEEEVKKNGHGMVGVEGKPPGKGEVEGGDNRDIVELGRSLFGVEREGEDVGLDHEVGKEVLDHKGDGSSMMPKTHGRPQIGVVDPPRRRAQEKLNHGGEAKRSTLVGQGRGVAPTKWSALLLHKASEHGAEEPSRSQSPSSLRPLPKDVFPSATPPLSSHSVQKLCSLLDTIGPADVGLSENASEDDRGHGFFRLNQLDRVPRWAQPITYVDIHECESFTICVFCFPTSAVIPLHDHPAMTVFSKVLYSSLHVKAYDRVEPARILNKRGPVRLAKLAVDNVLTEPCTTCTYYCDYPYFTFANEDEKSDEEENYAWLAETGTPDDLYMRPGKYNGPAIQV